MKANEYKTCKYMRCYGTFYKCHKHKIEFGNDNSILNICGNKDCFENGE